MNKNYKIMIVAGEASGDAHAAKLVHALRESSPATTFEFFGATSHHLRAAEVETIVKTDDFSIVGLPEIARALPMFWRAFQKLKKVAIDRKPDAVILVDFPDFNLKLAKSLKKRGLKIIYYISPQLWAWRKYRVRTLKNSIDLLLTILPFEKDWYLKHGVFHVEYVGNPLVREVYSKLSKDEFCAKHNLDEAKPIVALLAGSRHKEIARILPVMLEGASLMAEKNGEIQFVAALASTRKMSEIETAKSEISNLPKILIVVQDETREALNAADAAAVASGTATLETAIIGTPMAIVYKTSPLNYKLLRPLISVEHFGLINLIAQERLATELIQADFTKETLAKELFRLLEKEENRKMRERLGEVTETLGHGGASKRAAEFVLNFLSDTHQ
ncbi:MAG: lipid-A-disaccharide synthase [Acidobacteriota bacterium]|nr:lipid-A-disaccharide synthase [Acidobacteriota bacterium]